MGGWYMLMFFIGLCLMFAGALPRKGFPWVTKLVFLMSGTAFVALALFMFLPGSADTLADLLGLN